MDGRPVEDGFEQLWLLRACYLLRSGYDRRSTLSVHEVIAYGEQMLRLAQIRQRWRGHDTINHAS